MVCLVQHRRKLDRLAPHVPREALCGKVLGMGHVMTVVTKTVNYFFSQGLNHQQFKALLEEETSTIRLSRFGGKCWDRCAYVKIL